MRRRAALTILIIAVFGSEALYAQAPSVSLATITASRAEPAASTAAASPAAADPEARAVQLLVGRSMVINLPAPITRVSVTSAEVADVLVTTPTELLVNGKMPGTISMFVWNRAGAISRYEIVVQRDLGRLAEQLKQLFPGESIDVHTNGKDVVLSGKVSNKDVSDKAVNLAGGFVEKKEEVVSLLQLREGAPSNQVLLRVRFAEVSRNAMTELGAGFFTSPTGVKNTIGRVTTQQFAAPGFDELKNTKENSDFGSKVTSASGRFTFSDFLNLFLFSEKFDLGMMVRALQTRGLFQSLAEPNLVAESGKEASFLAGGEFPVPVPQASAAGVAITITFKEFGIRLNFTPVVNGDRVHLKVRPEVSTLDFNNAIVLQGFRIPALTTRRTETELELQNGQTFAIAGLINNTMVSSLQKVPGIGDIPILGLLFRSKAAQKDRTELVVMITPEILPNNSNGVTPNLPRLQEPYLPPLPDKQSTNPPPPAFRSAPATSDNAAPAAPAGGTPLPAAAAAAVSNLSPLKRAPTVHVEPTSAAPTSATPTAAAATVPPATVQPDATPSSSATRPMTAGERKIVERARKREQERAETEARVRASQAKRAAELAEQQRRKDKAEQERQAKLAREQAERDAEQAKRAAEQARKQAEIDKKREKTIAEAEAKLKAAQAAYEAELAKKQK